MRGLDFNQTIAPYVSKSYIHNNSGIFTEKAVLVNKDEWVRVASFRYTGAGLITISHVFNQGIPIPLTIVYSFIRNYQYTKVIHLDENKLATFGKLRIVSEEDGANGLHYLEFCLTRATTTGGVQVSLLSSDSTLLDEFTVYEKDVVDGVLGPQFDFNT